MKRSFVLLLAAIVVLAIAGCAHVDLTPEGDPNRVITGNVQVRMDLLPPADSVLMVRLVEPPDVTSAPAVAGKDLVLGERGALERPGRVVAEQVIRAPAGMPAPFRIEFRADDAELRRGLNLEARLSWGGRVRFKNLEAQLVTLPPGPAQPIPPQTIWIDPVR